MKGKAQVGDVVLITNGQKYEVIKINRTRFVGRKLTDGKDYNVPQDWFVKVVGKVEPTPEESVRLGVDRATLRPGDWFYINHRENAELYRFVQYRENGDIVGMNPINGLKTNIARVLFVGLVKRHED